MLSSGSRGNCTWIGDDDNGVIIDCGPSTKRIRHLMASVGLEHAPIDAVLITHEHGDHIGASRVLSKALEKRYDRRVPFYMTEGTWANARPNCLPPSVEVVNAGKEFEVGPFEITPISIPHDVADPVAYRVGLRGVSAAVVTDLGRPTGAVREGIRGVDALVLESNHDPDLLASGPYPWSLKQRIRSGHGHLSNQQSADLLRSIAAESLKEVVLAHLSDENNTPDHALAAARRALGDLPTNLSVGRQLEANPVLEIKPRLRFEQPRPANRRARR